MKAHSGGMTTSFVDAAFSKARNLTIASVKEFTKLLYSAISAVGAPFAALKGGVSLEHENFVEKGERRS